MGIVFFPSLLSSLEMRLTIPSTYRHRTRGHHLPGAGRSATRDGRDAYRECPSAQCRVRLPYVSWRVVWIRVMLGVVNGQGFVDRPLCQDVGCGRTLLVHGNLIFRGRDGQEGRAGQEQHRHDQHDDDQGRTPG